MQDVVLPKYRGNQSQCHERQPFGVRHPRRRFRRHHVGPSFVKSSLERNNDLIILSGLVHIHLKLEMPSRALVERQQGQHNGP